MLHLNRILIVALGMLIAAQPAFADPPSYRVELLDTGQFEAPSEHLPAGGSLAFVAFISPNARYVVVGVVDNNNSAPSVPDLVAIIDRATTSATLITDFERPFPFGINDDGAIVLMGTLKGGASSRKMYFWSPGTGPIVNEEGGLPRLISHGANVGVPRILNNLGQVLLQKDIGVDNMIWDPVSGTRKMIGPAPGADGLVQAVSLNNIGQVVGSIQFPTNSGNEIDIRPFIWDEAGGLRVLFDLELISPDISPFITFGRFAIANAINDAGVIAGETWDENGQLRGLHWDSESTVPTLLPCPESEPSQPPRKCAVWVLNDAGEFVGGEERNGSVRSHFIWDDAEPHLLRDLIVEGPTDCHIYAIANDGTLAGTCSGPGPMLVIPIANEPPTDTQGPVVADVFADPNPAPVGTPVQLTADIDDSDSGGSPIAAAHYTIDSGPAVAMFAEDGGFDEAQERVVADVPGFAEPGIYEVCVTGTDMAGNVSEQACTLVVVFDASGGFISGGGWIDVQAPGKANFGFIARYKKDASTPTGSTEFQVHGGDLNFHSLDYDWLVVSTAGTMAQLKGSGTVNGDLAPTGHPFRFLLEAEDSDPDTFGMRIWWDRQSGEVTVFDSGIHDIAQGSIVIHKAKN